MPSLTLWVSNQSVAGLDFNNTVAYLDAALCSDDYIMEKHPTITLEDDILSADDPEELWAVYVALRQAVADVGHATEDEELEALNPPLLVARLTPAEDDQGVGAVLQWPVSLESATWQDFCREAAITPEKLAEVGGN